MSKNTHIISEKPDNFDEFIEKIINNYEYIYIIYIIFNIPSLKLILIFQPKSFSFLLLI
jgi:hypothetical protein